MFVRQWALITINLTEPITHSVLDPSLWVKRFAGVIPSGRVLDLACGSGRHSFYLKELGYQVLGVDRDTSNVRNTQCEGFEVIEMDLERESWPLNKIEFKGQFSGVVVTNYLYRPYWDLLPDLLLEGGVLIYETFAEGNAEFGKPTHPNFLLKSGELLEFSSRHRLKVLAYEDIYVNNPKPAMIQRICSVKGVLKDRIPLQFQG